MTFLLADLPTITVHARAAYPSWKPDEHRWRDQDYDANFFTKAIKADREKLGSRVKNLPVTGDGSRVRISANNIENARSAYATWAAGKLKELDLLDAVLVPIPNSVGIVTAADFNTAAIARAIAAATGSRASVSTSLRFIEYRPKEGRERRPGAQELRENMTLVSSIPSGPIVLIDDVFTLGHHITAASWLMPQGRDPKHAIVASRTIKKPVEDVWQAITEDHFPF